MNFKFGNCTIPNDAFEHIFQVDMPPEVERRLEARWQRFCQQKTITQPEDRVVRPSTLQSPSLRAWGTVTIALISILAILITCGHRDAWGQVAKSVRSKSWMRLKLLPPAEVNVLEGSLLPETWLSSERKVYARRVDHAAQFIDFGRQITYDYDPHTQSLTQSSTRERDNIERVHIETLLKLVCEGSDDIQIPASAIQIEARTRTEVKEGSRRWIEFTFKCRNSDHPVDDSSQITFRVDPKTQLPFQVQAYDKIGPNKAVVERIFAIDYPETGPTDIYALGVPAAATIVDRSGAVTKSGAEIAKFLLEYERASRQRIEPFMATIFVSLPRAEFSDVYQIFRAVQGKEGIQFEEIDSLQLNHIRQRWRSGEIVLPQNIDLVKWWKDQTSGLAFQALVSRSDLFPNRIGYPDINFGASPINNPDCEVSLDRNPVSGPPGTVLLRIRVETKVGFNDRYYWIAPEKDYLVLRQEIHFSKDHAPWNNSTQIVDQCERSPSGHWYPVQVRQGRIAHPGFDLPADTVLASQTSNQAMGPVTTSLYRYSVDFN